MKKGWSKPVCWFPKALDWNNRISSTNLPSSLSRAKADTPKKLQIAEMRNATGIQEKTTPLAHAAALLELNFWSMWALSFRVYTSFFVMYCSIFYVYISWTTSKRAVSFPWSHFAVENLFVSIGGSGGPDYVHVKSLDQSLLRTKIKGLGTVKFQFLDRM